MSKLILYIYYDSDMYICGVRIAGATAILFVAVFILTEAADQARQAPSAGARMQQQIADVVKSFRGQMGVAAIDLGSGEVIAVDADSRFPTASTIKTAVMVEAWHQISAGGLTAETSLTLSAAHKVGGSGVLRDMHEGLALTIADLIHLMIVLSDNTATNMLIERLGTAKIDARLDALGLPQTRLFRPTFRDGRADVLPELEREYGLGMTTPREMARLMAMIGEGKAGDRRATEAMLATLRKQQDRAMIPRLIPASDGVQIGNKTGTDEEKHAGADGVHRHVRADAAIVTGPKFSFAIAIYARHIEDTRWGIENDALTTGARVARMVFEYFDR